jgi:hypothetical protein
LGTVLVVGGEQGGQELTVAYPALPRVTVKVLQPGVVMLPVRTVPFWMGGPELRSTISQPAGWLMSLDGRANARPSAFSGPIALPLIEGE